MGDRHPEFRPCGRLRSGCILATIALCVGLSPSGATAGIANILQQYQIQPIQPPVPANDFTLDTLAGGQFRLSEQQGRWVVLTFFATWCGPCASEMPSLQAFHTQHHPSGFDVVSIAGDNQKSLVSRFVRRKKMGFPVLLDPTGRISAMYQAQSIPVSYLIDPSGLIVGVARGARDWVHLGSMVPALLAAAPVNSQAPAQFSSNTNTIELPKDLVPPTAEVSPLAPNLEVNEPFELNVIITWAGHFQDYLLHPPALALPEHIQQLGMQANSSSAMGKRVLHYKFTLQADEPGQYALDPVEVRYTPRDEEQPVAARIVGPTARVAAATLFGFPPFAFAGSAGALALGLGLMAAMLRRRSRQNCEDSQPRAPTAQLRDTFTQIRKLRHDGDIPAFLEGLQNLDKHIGDLGNSAAVCDWDALIEATRYAGSPPPAQQLDQIQRQIELRIAQVISEETTGDAAPSSRYVKKP